MYTAADPLHISSMCCTYCVLLSVSAIQARAKGEEEAKGDLRRTRRPRACSMHYTILYHAVLHIYTRPYSTVMENHMMQCNILCHDMLW